jgi:hypothetical protein
MTTDVEKTTHVDVEKNLAVDVVPTITPSEYKYTEIDCLEEDQPIHGQRYVLLSFISPENIMNCSVRGIKVRGVYADYQQAQKAAEKLSKIDKYHHVFVGEVGKWLPWDPTEKQVEEEKFQNKKLDDIMKKTREAENKQMQAQIQELNEVAGRHREKIDENTNEFQARKKEMLKKAAKEFKPETEETPQQPEKVKLTSSNRETRNEIKERLRKRVEELKANKEKATVEKAPDEKAEREKIIANLQKMKTMLGK